MKRQNKRVPALLLTFILLLSMVSPAFAADVTFPDIEGHWAEETIHELAKEGIVHGYDDGLCHPDDLLSWGQCVLLIQRFYGQDATGYFPGVSQSDSISRIDMVQVMLRVLDKTPTAQERTDFKDDAIIEPQDTGYLNLANELGLIHGYVDGTIRPYQDVTRAEGFVMLKRLNTVYEQMKQENESKKPVQSSGSFSGSGTVAKPAPVIHFAVQEVLYAGSTVPVELTTENTTDTPVTWQVKLDGNEITAGQVISGDLFVFAEPGVYEITASAEGTNGKTATCTHTVKVFPVVQLAFTLPKTTHTDEAVSIVLSGSDLDGLPVTWTATKDGADISIEDFITGTLTNAGGTVCFTVPGTYALTASVTDELGRIYTDTRSTTVYPVGAVGFFMPSVFHTDDTVLVEATITELADNTLTWELTRNGEAVQMSKYITGTLTETGGTIQLAEKGDYVLSAAFTDATGRAYQYEQSFKVYPVPDVSFTLPNTAWTDTNITVSVSGTDMEGLTMEWLVDNTYGYQDWNTYVDGSLSNNGGTIRFKRAGTYELVTRTRDATGRVFLFEKDAKCEVQPVLELRITMPERFAAGEAVDIRTSGNNRVLPVNWTLKKDGKSVELSAYATGELNSYGGRLTFPAHGDYTLTASVTDVLGRVFSCSREFSVYPTPIYRISLPSEWHIGEPFQVYGEGEYLDDCQITWQLTKRNGTATYAGGLGKTGGEITVSEVGDYTLTATVTDKAGNTTVAQERIEITNAAPTMPYISLNVDYTDGVDTYTKNCRVKTNISVTGSTDPDGDRIRYEYDAASAVSGYYGLGEYMVKVRAVDQWGAASRWVTKTFRVECVTPTLKLTTELLDDNFVAKTENMVFNAAVTSTTPYRITALDYYYPEGADSTSDVPAMMPTTVKGTYPDGRHLVVAQVKDWFGNTAYASQFFIVGSPTGGSSTELTDLSTTVQENGIYDGETPLAYIESFSVSIPAISGHNTSCNDVVTIYGITESGEQEPLLQFKTNNGYVYADSDGSYQYTDSGSTVTTGDWTGWESEKYTRLIFNYEMTAGHQDCIARASEGLSYTVRYKFIEGSADNLESLFE